MRTKVRFNVVEVENAKGFGVSAWKVFETRDDRAEVWECETERDARKLAAAKNAKERLRTAKIVSIDRAR